MTPEQLSEQLVTALGDNLASVIVYGSAASGEQTKPGANINVCLVVNNAGVSALNAMRPALREWTKAGHPWPAVFTSARLPRAGDVFPIEFADIKRAHRTVYGKDFFTGIAIDPAALRTQLEYELRVKLLRLREIYLETAGEPKRMREALARALPSLAAMGRTALRLMGDSVDGTPASKIWVALAAHVAVNVEAFDALALWREKNTAADRLEPEAVFAQILASLELLTDFVDQLSLSPIQGGERR